ncbi:V4R domain-containing protein [Leptolyngbya sp. NIES-2104]|uniref:V4R domain-containing protein n=1 Tax=Leptolyngbya sp. NIES-2104 TaxID=1552121 RepID=UPI0006EC8365|nr:V4R domain-containing protein [Leptolyngbya sp. NIES-2104]GAP95495.1 V4R domain protein [Leptolyngbya sp. NIES-2104]
MISVSDLLIHDRLPANYYASDVYVRGDLEMGLLESRRGDRLLSLPETLIQAIYAGLNKETGQASRLVLFNCGRWWGKSFFSRFRDEVSDYYGTPLVEMQMADFLQALKQCWITCGLGKLSLDQTYHDRGFLIVETHHSPFARLAIDATLPSCHLEAGIFTSVFSQLAGRELHCMQTRCESMGAESNLFVIGVQKRLEAAEVLVEKQLDHESILPRLFV